MPYSQKTDWAYSTAPETWTLVFSIRVALNSKTSHISMHHEEPSGSMKWRTAKHAFMSNVVC